MSLYTNGLQQFLEVLPGIVRDRLERSDGLESLIEVVLDYGRVAEARYRDRVERFNDIVVSEHDLEFVARSIGEFGSDNRAGIERTLHRISAIRNRHDKVIGLTCRVGRALEGTIDMIDDIVRSGQSILLLGRPGVGKTTKLREIARVLADEASKRVVIVDTSNEIAGDGDVPHAGIGSARRMQVRLAYMQHAVMIEAVENHMPEVIVIDEIGTEQEAAAARTIAERGVQLVGTAHGQTLENLMLNPTLADLIGGIQAVTLSDAEAQRRGTQKTVLERKAPPTFDIVIELMDYERLAVHHNVQKTVDLILRGLPPRPEVRVRTGAGGYDTVQREVAPEVAEAALAERIPSVGRRKPVEKVPSGAPGPNQGTLSPQPARLSGNGEVADSSKGLVRVFPYGIARTRLERAIREKKAPVTVVTEMNEADVVMAIRSTVQNKPRRLRDLAGRSIPTVVVKSNTFSQISSSLEEAIRRVFDGVGLVERAIEELEVGLETVISTGRPYDLAPQPAGARRSQIKEANGRNVMAECVGMEPHRHVRLMPVHAHV